MKTTNKSIVVSIPNMAIYDWYDSLELKAQRNGRIMLEGSTSIGIITTDPGLNGRSSRMLREPKLLYCKRRNTKLIFLAFNRKITTKLKYKSGQKINFGGINFYADNKN